MKNIRVILFDAGNTLLQLDLDFVASVTGAQTDALFRSELKARLVAGDGFAKGVDDRTVVVQYFTDILTGAGVSPDALEDAGRALRKRHRTHGLWSAVADGAHDVLVELRARGYRTACISNADGRVESYLETVGLAEHLDFVIDSAVVGVQKPDPAIFALGCEKAGCVPGEAAYVGDIPQVDVAGAEAAGLTPILIDPLDSLAEVRCTRIRALTDLLELFDARDDRR